MDHISGDVTNRNLVVGQALSLVSRYFPCEWAHTRFADVELRKIRGGFVNRLHLLTRRNKAEKEPDCVLVRQFGLDGIIQDPFEECTTLSAADQAIVYYEMGRRCWGPKLYGSFYGGRLEQWIDSHPLSAAESMEPNIRGDIARSYARFHCLDLPLPKNNFKLIVAELKQRIQQHDEIVSNLVRHGSNASLKFATDIRSMSWSEELNWLLELFIKHQCKASLTIGDTNFLNILVKEYESDCQVMLIDYETASYTYRGIDIGGHFNDRMYQWSHPSNCLTGYASPSANEQRLFCESYVQELQTLDHQLGSTDTVEHILLESKVGMLYQIVFSLLISFVDNECMTQPQLQAGLSHMIKTYKELKDDFVEGEGEHATN